MAPLRRRKRDTAENIYRNCKPWGTCPPDVINKVEGTTVADQILKYGSGLTYFGGLGIGTGPGGGGRLGYLPLGNRPAGRPAVPFYRPQPPVGIPVETIPEIVGGDVVDATADSIVPLLEDVTRDIDVAVTSGGPTAQPGPTRPNSTEISLLPPTRDVTVTQSTHENPMFDPITVSDTHMTQSVTVESTSVGTFIGESFEGTVQEEIELHSLGGGGASSTHGSTFSETIVDETPFSSSTPRSGVQVTTRFGGSKVSAYNRRFVQVEVSNPLFLSEPEVLVQAGAPRSVADTSLTFDSGGDDFTPAPHADFQNLRKLSQPYYTQGPSGHVRVSRLGQESSIETRSGLVIGPQKHYYHDLSTVTNAEETVVLNVDTPSITVGQGPPDSYETISLSSLSQYSDSDLLDIIEPVGEDLHLVLGGTRRKPPATVPVSLSGWSAVLGSVTVDYSSNDNSAGEHPDTPAGMPAIPVSPAVSLGGANYWLEPSLIKKKRKKKRLI
ncbi:putative minor capsid protein L2 [Ovis aries papillomavirus 3]|uniref:Minor capsid protein L2 n=1 Tax=Ovis aries papillomavirus 3 TaxID=634772 RepID=D5FL29_9PAPI|nr:putative minor capsid protein L2 [Ovis aries papillomavirus 3]ACO58660.1 putative minor capsid protein L2 [Ovis aries papillomavirus 3]